MWLSSVTTSVSCIRTLFLSSIICTLLDQRQMLSGILMLVKHFQLKCCAGSWIKMEQNNFAAEKITWKVKISILHSHAIMGEKVEGTNLIVFGVQVYPHYIDSLFCSFLLQLLWSESQLQAVTCDGGE